MGGTKVYVFIYKNGDSQRLEIRALEADYEEKYIYFVILITVTKANFDSRIADYLLTSYVCRQC